MASFDLAFERTMGFEGFYSLDPDDPGGETFRGISRNAHPDWEGWLLLKPLKSQPDFPNNLKNHTELNAAVVEFYRGIWERTGCDLMEEQMIADTVFDTAVNLGEPTAIKMLQSSLNVLSKNGTLWPFLEVDGIAGNKTRNAIQAANSHHVYLSQIIGSKRDVHYTQIVERRPVMSKYIRGWLKRRSIP